MSVSLNELNLNTKVVIFDDNKDWTTSVADILNDYGIPTVVINNLAEARSVIAQLPDSGVTHVLVDAVFEDTGNFIEMEAQGADLVTIIKKAFAGSDTRPHIIGVSGTSTQTGVDRTWRKGFPSSEMRQFIADLSQPAMKTK